VLCGFVSVIVYYSAKKERDLCRSFLVVCGFASVIVYYIAKEDMDLCRSFLVVLVNPVCGNGQCNMTFWEPVEHFTMPTVTWVKGSRRQETKFQEPPIFHSFRYK